MSAEHKQSLSAVTTAAIGVVYGDIGTSPLYTLRECFSGHYGFDVRPDVVFGFLSLIFWMLIVIVSLKYLTYVMRADNAGEGGILTLMSLAGRNTSARTTAVLVILGLIGGSFFYGEVVITPAISVMSAIEGLEIAAPALDAYIVPLSILVLTLLFAIQKHGTGSVGKLFAPVMLLWFIVLAVLGARSIISNPEVLQALNPKWALNFFMEYKKVSFFALGAVVLSITGVEALYADMGHFGKFPIRGTVHRGVAIAGAQLLRRGALLLKTRRRSKPVLPVGARLGADPAVDSGDHGDGYRLAGGNFRRLLADPSGGASWLSVADAHHSHLGNGIRPDLYSGDQLDAVHLGGAGDHRLRTLQQSGGGVRHRRHRHHGADQHSGHLGGDQQLALESLHGDRHRDHLADHRRADVLRQRPEAVLRRLVAADLGAGDVHHYDHGRASASACCAACMSTATRWRR